jgi:hypothetical protein
MMQLGSLCEAHVAPGVIADHGGCGVLAVAARFHFVAALVRVPGVLCRGCWLAVDGHSLPPSSPCGHCFAVLLLNACHNATVPTTCHTSLATDRSEGTVLNLPRPVQHK